MAISDVYQVVVEGEYLGKACFQRWWYYQVGSSGTGVNVAQLIADKFENDIMPAVCLAQVDSMNWSTVRVYNYSNVAEFVLQDITQDGDVAGEGLASMYTATVMQARLYPGRNYPMKRFSGIPEASVSGNSFLTTYRDAWEAACELWRDISDIGFAIDQCVFKNTFPLGTPGATWLLGGNAQTAGAFISVKPGTQKTRK